MQNNFSKLEEIINYKFKNQEILKLALTHPSYANEHALKKFETNQRLEYLGDAVLELSVSNFLYNKYKEFDEGHLTKTRALLVCEDSLSNIGRSLYLYDYLLLGKGELREKIKDNNSVMCDAVEAVIGAIYIDSNIESAFKFIDTYIINYLDINNIIYDYKSNIQIYSNSKNAKIEYEVINEYGPDHNKMFEVCLKFNDKIISKGIGKSKKDAEQKAAKNAIGILEGI